jgi:1A family penicillin-binding protein
MFLTAEIVVKMQSSEARPARRFVRLLVRGFQVAFMLGVLAIVIGTVVGITYVVYQNRRLPELEPLEYGEVSTWKQHTEIFSDVGTINIGEPWSVVKRRLERLEYASAPEPSLRDGNYAGSGEGNGRLVVFTRDFYHPRIRQVPQPYAIRFENGGVKSISTPSGQQIARVYLEPELIDELYNVDEGLARQLIAIEQAPRDLINAFLASEDNDFYKHPGIHARRFAVAMFWNVLKGTRQGASTITQQLARNLMLTRQQILERKVKEWILAVQIERRYSKDEILERYLNFIDLGRHSGRSLYGVKEAARYYFNKDVSELSLAECALLAAIPKSPTTYSPVLHPENARERRNLILRLMYKRGYISRQDMVSAQKEELVVAGPRRNRFKGTAPYFSGYIRATLEEKYTPNQLYNEGMRVYTTLDPVMQEAAERAVIGQLEALDTELRYPSYRSVLAQIDAGQTPSRKPDDYIQAALVSIEVQTGYVRALVGGRDYQYQQYNRAAQARRQPGSAFKPFVYTAAWERGLSPSTTIVDEPWSWRGWRPENIGHSYAGTVTLRQALVRSLNIPAARLMNEYVGATATVKMAKRCGIESPLGPYPSLALGSSEVTPLEITAAYGTFANNGMRVQPTPVRYVVDNAGRILEDHIPETTRAMDERIAATTNAVLQDVVNYGTGARVRRLGFTYPAAGKTGTTSDYTDAWFIGYTPRIVTGVWVGFDDPKKSVKGTGSEAALPIWAEYMKSVIRGPEETFAAPSHQRTWASSYASH